MHTELRTSEVRHQHREGVYDCQDKKARQSRAPTESKRDGVGTALRVWRAISTAQEFGTVRMNLIYVAAAKRSAGHHPGYEPHHRGNHGRADRAGRYFSYRWAPIRWIRRQTTHRADDACEFARETEGGRKSPLSVGFDRSTLLTGRASHNDAGWAGQIKNLAVYVS
jgi:hypothetical protein